MRRCVSPILSVILSLMAASAAPGAQTSWPTFRGANGTGEAPGGLPPGDGPLSLELRWKHALGSGYAGIAIAEGTLVTAFTEGQQDFVVALDPTTGEQRWRYPLAPIYPGHDGSHDGPISTPAIANGRVFALSAWGHLVALELASGTEIWSTHLVEDLGSEKPYYGFGSSPTVAGRTLVLQVGGKAGSVAGFDVATGKLRWRTVEDEIGAQSPVLTELAGKRQIVVLGGARLAGVDPEDGAILWQIEHGATQNAMGAYTASPLPLGNDRLLVKLDNNQTAIVKVTAGAAGMTASIEQTSSGLTKSYSPPARAADQVLGYTARFLSAVDSESGELLWRSRDPGDGFPTVVGDQLAVLTKTGALTLGPAGADGWQETTRLDLFEDLAWTSPSYADGALYLRSLGEIARVDLVRETGAQTARAGKRRLPKALEALAASLEGTDQTSIAVDAFLDGRSLPLVDGEEVVFIWRGPAQDVAIAGEMIGMRTEEPMQRLPGTDLWWWSTTLDRHARISYLFFVDYEPTTDPTHGRTTRSTILGADMNWNRGEGIAMSWFAMPEWPGLELLASDGDARTGTAGTLDSLELSIQPPAPDDGEAPEPITASLPVWLPAGYEATDQRYPVIYVSNDTAREAGGWRETLDRVSGTTAAPTIVVFLELRVRGQGQILAEQIVPAVDELYRTIADRDHRALVGMGWPGSGAAVTAFHHADLFGILGVQSFFALEAEMAEIHEAIGDRDASTLPLRIYLEWGRWDLISPHEEMNFRVSSRAVWELLREKGWQPIGGEVWDSTDWGSWSNRTGVLLEALFPLAGRASDLGGWLTSAP